MEQVSAIQLRGITKRFGSVVANDGIDLEVRRGEILSLLGENGSGKTTLMNMISGIYFPDEGHIQVGGREVTIRSPKDAYALGIGTEHRPGPGGEGGLRSPGRRPPGEGDQREVRL